MFLRTIYFLLCTVNYLLLLTGAVGVMGAMVGFLVIGIRQSDPGFFPIASGIEMREFVIGLVIAAVVWGALWALSAMAAVRLREAIEAEEADVSRVSLRLRHRWARAIQGIWGVLMVSGILLAALVFEFLALANTRQLFVNLSTACFVAAFVALVVSSYIAPFSRDPSADFLPFPLVTVVAVVVLGAMFLIEPALCSSRATGSPDWHGPFSGIFALVAALPEWVAGLVEKAHSTRLGRAFLFAVCGVLLLYVLAGLFCVFVPSKGRQVTGPQRLGWILALLPPALLVREYLGGPYLSAFQSGYLHLLTLVSAATFFLYAVDKAVAEVNAEASDDDTKLRRIPEDGLLWTALLGGWPGAFLASAALRHKTTKVSFQSPFRTCVVLHCLVVTLAIWASYYHKEVSPAPARPAAVPSETG